MKTADKPTIPKLQADDVAAKANMLRPDALDKTRIEDLISNLLASSENMLEILPEEDLNIALQNFVEKDEKSAIEEFVKATLHNTQQLLVKEDPSKTTQPDFIYTLVTEHTAQLRERFLRDRASAPNDYDDDIKFKNYDNTPDDASDKSDGKKKKGRGKAKQDDDDNTFQDDEDDDDSPAPKDTKKRGRPSSSDSPKSTPKRGRGSGSATSSGSTTSSGGKGRGRGKTVSASKYALDFVGGSKNDDDEDNDGELRDNRGLKKVKTEHDDEMLDDDDYVPTPKNNKKTPNKNNNNSDDNDSDHNSSKPTNSAKQSAPPVATTSNWGKRRNTSQKN